MNRLPERQLPPKKRHTLPTPAPSGILLRHILGEHAVAGRKPVVVGNLLPVQQQTWLPAGWTTERALLDDVGQVLAQS